MGKVIITRKESAEKVKGPDSIFSGEVGIELSVPKRDKSNLSGGLVTFQPRGRTNWHTHPCGQLLIIAKGKGRVQELGQPVQEVFPGDLVWFPAGVTHWHGASFAQEMAHYAIQEELDGQAVTWMNRVTDEEYNGK